MFSCCCADTATRGDLLTEEKPEVFDGASEVQDRGHSVAAATPAAATPAAANDTAGAPATASDAAAAPQEAAAAAAAAAAPTNDVAAAKKEGPPVSERKMNFAATKKQDAPPPKKPMTAPTVERARRTSVPLECPLDDGVFLMYEKETDTVYAQWSKTPQTTALAWLKPLVAIPEHKYKVNGGRQNLFTKAVEEGKYYKGWIRFICIVNEYPSKLMLLENFAAAAAPDVQLLLLIPSGVAAGEASAAAAAATAAGGGGGGAESTCVAVALDLYNKLYDLKNVFAVAAVPCSSKLIPTQQPITPHKFLQMGTGEGDAASIHLKKT